VAKEKKWISVTERTPAENNAITEKIQVLIDEGFPSDQATAIALRMYRDGELDIRPIQAGMQSPRTERERKKRLLKNLKTAFDVLGLDKLFKPEVK